MSKVIIVGGGPAGMMAAIAAKQHQNEVHLFEKNEVLGKKLLLTGHGRCNVTNSTNNFFKHLHSNPKFLYSAFHSFSNQDMIHFLEENGCPLIEEAQGRLFPKTQKAQTILDVLNKQLKDVDIHYQEKVEHLLVEDNSCIGIQTPKGIYKADTIIVATGGMTFQQTGSCGDGIRFTKEIGIPVKACKPGLISLETKEKYDLQGISLPVTFKINKYKSSGDILFTHFGLSGPAIINASSCIELPATITIDLLPQVSNEELHDQLIHCPPNKDIESAFELLPKRLWKVICGNIKHKKMHDLTKKERNHLVDQIKNFTMTLINTRPANQGMITVGGIDTKAINAKTMESKTIANLRFAGEVIDLDGQTGGYNLQIAWTTGYVAGATVE